MWSSLRAIADEALATAKELRDVPNLGSVYSEPKQGFRQDWNAQTVTVNSRAEQTIDTNNDVSSRLAALRAKIAAQGNAPDPHHPNPKPLDSLAVLQGEQPSLPRAATGSGNSDPAIVGNSLREEDQQEQLVMQNRVASILYKPPESGTVAGTGKELKTRLPVTTGEEGKVEEELRITKDLLMEERNKSSALQSALEGLQRRLDEAVSQTSMHEQEAQRVGGLESLCAKLDIECHNLRAELEGMRQENFERSSIENSEDAAAKLQLELEKMHEALGAAETEKMALKSQLTRLKTQMLSEQDDAEEEIKLRVDAEVKIALEKLSSAAQENSLAEKQMSQELTLALERAERAERDVAKLEQVCASRDFELANMQRALGELSFEADIAEKLRGELRILQSDLHSTRMTLEEMQKAKTEAEDLVSRTNAEIVSLKSSINVIKEAEAKSRRETLEAQMKAQAFARQLEELRESTGNSVFKKETILNLLASILPIVRRKKDVISLAKRVLDLRDEDVGKVMDMSKQIQNHHSGPSLVSSWIDFLETASQGDSETTQQQQQQ